MTGVLILILVSAWVHVLILMRIIYILYNIARTNIYLAETVEELRKAKKIIIVTPTSPLEQEEWCP